MSIICKLTKTEGKSVRAHIVPKAFYDLPLQQEGVSKIYSNSTGAFPKKMPMGVYDDGIVTIEGEAVFGGLDNYAVDLLLNQIDAFDEISKNGDIGGWHLKKYDYKLLKLFALSVLWRAHSSTKDIYSKVALGRHEPAIREMVLARSPGREENYSVIFARWQGDDIDNVIMDPFLERYEGINYYRIYCGKYIIYVKVDSRKTRGVFSKVQLKPDSPLYVICREFNKSKERKVMVDVLSSHNR